MKIKVDYSFECKILNYKRKGNCGDWGWEFLVILWFIIKEENK